MIDKLPNNFNKYDYAKSNVDHSRFKKLFLNNLDMFTDNEIWLFFRSSFCYKKTVYSTCLLYAVKSRFVLKNQWLLILDNKPESCVEVVANIDLGENEDISNEFFRHLYLILEGIALNKREPNNWLATQLYYHHKSEFIRRYNTPHLYKVVR